jgi:hypothetical protein
MSGKQYVLDTTVLEDGIYVLSAGRSVHKVVVKH